MSTNWRQMEEVAEIAAGIAFPKALQGRADASVPVFKVGDISRAAQAGQVVLSESPNHVEPGELKGTPLPAGAVVFAKIGEALKLNRRAILGVPAYVDNNVMALVPREELIDSRFLYYFMLTVDLGPLSQATAVPSVRKSDVKRIPAPLPTLNVQSKVVEEIETQFTRLETANETMNRVKLNLKRHRRATVGRVMGLRDWPEEPLGDVTSNFDALRVPLKRADRDKRDGPFPYYGASGVIDYIDKYIFDGRFLLIAEDGANLLSRSTPIAFHAEGRFWVNNHAHVVQTSKGLSSDFLAIVLNHMDISRYVTGTAQPKLTQTAMNRIPVPIPPQSIQDQIIAEIDRVTTISNAIEMQIQEQTVRTKRLRQSVLARAFAELNLVKIVA